MLELYGGHSSTCCQKVRLVAEEKGQQVVEREVSVWKHENLRPEYLRMNRDGMIPTVVHDGLTLVESSVIMRYLDRVFADPPLTPTNPVEAMRMDLMMKDLDDKYHNAIAFVSFTENSHGPDGELTEKGRERLKSFDNIPEPQRREQRRRSILLGWMSDEGRNASGLLDTMVADIDAALELGPFLAGSNYSLADAALTPYVHRLWELGCEPIWTQSRPRVGAWFDRMRARKSFHETITKNAHNLRRPQSAEESARTGTWSRFRKALESIGTRPDDAAARLPARIWSVAAK
jgi:glutathione S-transferase